MIPTTSGHTLSCLMVGEGFRTPIIVSKNWDAGTATRVRKIGSTTSVQTCSTLDATLLVAHMGHSQPTQQTYYQGITAKKHAASAHLLREQLRKEAAGKAASSDEEAAKSKPQNKSQQKRMPFSEEETAAIGKRFASYIESGKTPTRSLCQQFIVDTKSKRDPKHIQDNISAAKYNRYSKIVLCSSYNHSMFLNLTYYELPHAIAKFHTSN